MPHDRSAAKHNRQPRSSPTIAPARCRPGRVHPDERDVLSVPLLGRTPLPWRWPADVMAICVGTPAHYVSAVAAADDTVRRLGR